MSNPIEEAIKTVKNYSSGYFWNPGITSNAIFTVPYRTVVTDDTKSKLISESDDKYKTFVEKMYPIVHQTLLKKDYPTKNINNILKQMAFESNYGLEPRGNGYNLSGIKAWNENEGSKHSDGQYYRNFNDYWDFTNFYVDLLNNRYDALNSENTRDYINRLHNGKNGAKYSERKDLYDKTLLNMRSLEKAISNYRKTQP